MMGSGIKAWADGDVLTAADVNGYLMRQAVVTCTSSTRPASPVTGQPIYETDTKQIRVWDGSTWYHPASPDYTDYASSVVFYSNAVAGTAIGGGSVSVTAAKYQVVGKRCHYYGHATINTTTASGFALSLPVATPIRAFWMNTVYLHGTSGYTTCFGTGHVPAISAPYNRFGPVSNSNAVLNIANSGDTVHWNVVYETV